MSDTLSSAHAAAAAAHAGLSLARGQAVLDLVTGDGGTIQSGRATHRPIAEMAHVSAAAAASLFKVPQVQLVESYTVQLANGAVVDRERNELVKIPANLAADLEGLE